MEISELYEENIDKIKYQWVVISLTSLVEDVAVNFCSTFRTSPFYKGDLLVGIDPGSTHLGITLLPFNDISKSLLCFEITLPSKKTSIESALAVCNAFYICMKLGRMNYLSNFPAIIEGPSYGERYGQAKLAEMRIALALEIHNKFYGRVLYSPPKSIRKIVFGDGKIIAKKLWKDILLPDAADSLACALAGLKLFARKENE